MTRQLDALDLLLAMTRVIRHQRSASTGGTTPLPKLSVLAVLAEHDLLDLEGLAEKELVQAPSMVETLKPLIASGWIAKQTDPSDRRRIQLRLTPSGRRHLGTERRRLKALFAGLNDLEAHTLIRAAGVLRTITSQTTELGE